MNRARDWWEGLGRNNQIILVATTLSVIIALVGFVTWASTPEYVPLFSNLNAQDEAAISDKLRESNVSFRLQQGGTAIEVPAQVRDEVRMKIMSQGLPQQTSATVGYELLDTKGTQLGVTQQQEDMTMLRAKEGEISKSIMSLEQVASASVHVAPSEDSPFASSKHDATASVLVTLRTGQSLSDENVRAIVRMTQMSYPGLTEKGISVVDSHGDPLFDGMHAGGLEGGERIKQQRAIAQAKRTELQQLLDTTIGPHKAVVLVNAELNSDQEETETHRVEPGAVISSSSDTENLAGAGTIHPGAPGATANLPGAPPANPSLTGAAPGTPTYPGVTTTDPAGNYKHETVTKSMEAGHTDIHKIKAPGRIEKLTVSALVDAKVPADQVATIKQALETAIATDPTDATHSRLVTVAQIPFDRTSEDTESKAAAAARSADNIARMISIAVPLGLMLVCFFMLARALRKPRLTLAQPQLALAGGGRLDLESTDDGLALMDDEDSLSGQTVGSILTPDNQPRGIGSPGNKTYTVIEEAFDANLESILHLTRSKPETVANLVKSWLAEALADTNR